jgi:chloride channel 7
MNMAVYNIHKYTFMLTERVTWASDDGQPRVALGYLTYVGTNGLLVLIAAGLTHWQPAAAMSGLPKLKSYLNGTYIRGGMLSFKSMVAKVIGITLVVATGLPLGKEGPMVHIGAMVAAIFSRHGWPGTHRMLELRLPQPQREWIGMGAAAGVAAAFNAPFGGILYSFEEVCSHWTATLTWRSFFCCMLVAMTYRLIVELSRGEVSSAPPPVPAPPRNTSTIL